MDTRSTEGLITTTSIIRRNASYKLHDLKATPFLVRNMISVGGDAMA
eukprot:CAMPEP_0170168758 /NCGR_PEP_ID=MMETSP0040_2-20121228/1706_1 /TAXON_ID=641309 /ORGANISM="Lotharella oceanica, Strain CCMP622" /LENGTH=46 /DNA_ID= /DNA_START= /DNA_END= /DNA_ORIENTATION=